MPVRLFISTGEASGDAYGAALVEAIRQIEGQPFERIEAVGGKLLLGQGANLVADSSDWGAISIVQSIGVAMKVIRGVRSARAALKNGDPGLFVPIDFGFVNIRMARIAKAAGWKVLYFIPPGSWRKDRQGADLPKVSDEIVTPFEWSAEILTRMGASAHWFGHPIKSLLTGTDVKERTSVAVLPGSRRHEIEANLPEIAKAANGLPEIEFAVAPNLNVEHLAAEWKRLSGRTSDRFSNAGAFGTLQRARAAIVCSGTATLQAAVARCPMVVVYRLSRAMEIEGRLLGMRKRIKFISLPNIFLDREAIPELIHDDATGISIRAKLDELIAEGPARTAQLAAFAELDQMLGPSDCIQRTAELAVRMAGASE